MFESLGSFALFFGAGLFCFIAFFGLYSVITPHNEMNLIRQGEKPPAIVLSGALIGFTLPVAVSIVIHHRILDMVVWAGVALVVQLVLFMIARLIFCRNIGQKNSAMAIFMASLSICVGLLNAATMID